MDRGENRQLVRDQIETWIRNWATEYLGPHEIVLRRLDLEGRPAETLHTCRLRDGAYGTNPDDVVESHLHNLVEAAQRDVNARKAGLQIYALYPFYEDGTHGRRKKFRAATDEAEPAPAGGGTP
jgi:hypothetical protein